MVIRMKEWGMMALPKAAPHLSTKGINDMASANDAFARSIRSAGADIGSYINKKSLDAKEASESIGKQDLEKEKETAKLKVAQMGALSNLAETLQHISKETEEELAENKVIDWNYAWNKSVSPRISNAISQLPAEHQAAGNVLAERFNLQASIKAKRNNELKAISNSRNQWNDQMQRAIQEGDSTKAEKWLELGMGTFVPESDLELRRKDVRSKCQLQEWQQALESAPIKTLASISNHQFASPELLDEDALRLKESVLSTRRLAKEQLAINFKSSIFQDSAPNKATIQLAKQAQLIPQDEAEDYPANNRKQLYSLCSWIKRIDESPLEEDEVRHDLEIELATSALPRKEKMKFIERIGESSQITSSARLTLSRQIWNLYYNGQFGSPGDKVSLSRLQHILESQLPTLAALKDEEVQTWMQKNSQKQNIWITYSQPTTPNLPPPAPTNETIA